MPAQRSVCPITREQFRADAEPIVVRVGNQDVLMDVKEFSTKSLGWYANGKLTVEVGGVRVPCQLGFTLTLVSSKDLPQ